MKKINFFVVFLLYSIGVVAQHTTELTVDYLPEKHTLNVYQELTFVNTTDHALDHILLNDWNHAYSDRNTPLADRFADEFMRSFHVASERQRGFTFGLTIIDDHKSLLNWNRLEGHPDIVRINLPEAIAAGRLIHLTLTYSLQLPDAAFTGYGYKATHELNLTQWMLTPARIIKGAFLVYSNLNIDDVANAPLDVRLTVRPAGYTVVSNLESIGNSETEYLFEGKNRLHVQLYFTKNSDFLGFKTSDLELISNLNERRINDLHKAIIVDKIRAFVDKSIGNSKVPKFLITQSDYEANPFYGLNQLPNFIRPFPDDFIYELKFLKTYLYNRLKETLRLDPRKDNWLFDAIQIYVMMHYLDEHYPNFKMMGSLSKIKLLKGYRLLSLDFNEQYSYFYMLMARKNLDQPLGESKDNLLKFNEKIASKYRAGLSFRYLADYLGQDIVDKTIVEFIAFAQLEDAAVDDFQKLLQKNSGQNLDWFFTTIINSREIIDYRFREVSKTNDQISFQLKNRTNSDVPIPVFGMKKKEIVFKKWLFPSKQDSVYVFDRKEADKIVLNYHNIVPEFNQRNNWKSLKPFFISNRPIKFRFLKDLEDPNYNQIMYLPTIGFNFYDGVIVGLSLNNRTVLDKPISFDLIPSFSTTSTSFSGSFNVTFNQYLRHSNLFSIRYGVGGSFFRYAPDATYEKFTPFIQLRIREKELRKNHLQFINLRNVYVNRAPSNYVKTTGENQYSVIDIRFTNAKTTITKTFTYSTDFQFASQFVKTSGEVVFRQLFQNNRQLNLRFYGGVFLRNNDTKDYFSFALERPTDYLFDYSFLGRSESTGIFRQQFITAEGGFKSRFTNQLANQWLVATNISGSIWNWVEAYADFGMLKDQSANATLKMDSGIRLNLVTDYFELYFPVYSSNGWDIGNSGYAEKIRFVVTLNPRSLVGLFTRKWF